MNAELHRAVTDRLQEFGFKDRGKWLEDGCCPSCGKRTLYTCTAAPWVLRCNRLNHCGCELHIKDVYPDLFESWSNRHPRTEQNPHAAADAYLRDARGFDIGRLLGWYTQETYWSSELNAGSATVRFELPGIGWWERIIDQPDRFGDRKATFRGAYGGTWWQPPGLAVTAAREIWITEGIFDTIALLHHGLAAVSALSSNNYPAKSLQEIAVTCTSAGAPRPTLIWALDGDKAGRDFTKKHASRARAAGWDCRAAQIPQLPGKKLDWNDLHQRDRLNPNDIDEYLYHGAVLLADSPRAKALMMHSRKGWRSFSFEHENRLYWFSLSEDRLEKAADAMTAADNGLSSAEISEKAATDAATVNEIANCLPSALYFQCREITDESWYYFKIDFPHSGKPIKNTFTGSQLASSTEFKKRLLSIAPGAVWIGNQKQLDRLLTQWTFDLKRVETVDFIGYSKEHHAYIYNDVAICNGKLHKVNAEDFFSIGKLSVKSLSRSIGFEINHDPKSFNTEWLSLLTQCFGPKGTIALAFWLGTLFAEQIRESQKSYPFLEIVGEAGAGKSTLIEFLWKLCGRAEYEGFDPVKSSLAARSRSFAQMSNLPVVLIESDRDPVDSAAGRPMKNWDWDELKPLYNGRSIRSRGMKNQGNETYEPPFRGSIVISQNIDVIASEAILSRIIQLKFDTSRHTVATKEIAQRLEGMPIEQLSYFIIKSIINERAILDLFEKLKPEHENILLSYPQIKTFRIAKCHAQIMALIECLQLILPLSSDDINAAHIEMNRMVIDRQSIIGADHPLVQEFWDAYEFLESKDGPTLNHSRDDLHISINLNEFEQTAMENHIRIPLLSDLKRILKSSRIHKFIAVKAIRSVTRDDWNRMNPGRPRPTTVKCWVFQA